MEPARRRAGQAAAEKGRALSGPARRLIIVEGTPEQTAERAGRLLAASNHDDVLWVDGATRSLADRLGQAFDAVVVDAHAGLDADVLGQAQGLVWGAGALVLRRGGGRSGAALAVFPYREEDVGQRWSTRAWAVLEAAASSDAPLRPVERRVEGTADQRRVVAALVDAWRGKPSRTVVLADRGRGKSSALGLAIAELATPVAVTAGSEAAAREVLRFAGAHARFVPISSLLDGTAAADVIAVDEAAQIPVPVLARIVQRHPGAHLAFATTTSGYEGTGRGFVLRFVEWLEREHGPVRRAALETPIRWGPDDPVERAVFDALLLDAEPSSVGEVSVDGLRIEHLDRDRLVADPGRLRALFGLLVHAHYRTTPSDLHRLLDAPNLSVHAALHGDRVLGATLVAEEGRLPPQLCEDATAGRIRLRAHALADALVAHLGRTDAGAFAMARSVRIAVHPDARRLGIATRLVEHVHAHHRDAELQGTLFGATAQLVAFRRSVGYEVVRLSASRGARTGEPSVMMVRPTSARAQALVHSLREELARELPLQLELLQADGELLLDPGLVEALRAGLPSVAPWTEAEARARVQAYAHGPLTFESVATAVRAVVQAASLDDLPANERAVIEGRVLHGHGWRRVTADAGMPSVPAAMRALRRGVRALL